MEDRLHNKYIVTKASGEPVDEHAKYFVLRYDNDKDALAAAMLWASLKGLWGLFEDLQKYTTIPIGEQEGLGVANDEEETEL